MLLGYNTNGLSDIGFVQAIELIRSTGYLGIAITLDHGLLDPYHARFDEELERTAALLKQHGMRCVIETGARFLLNPQVKHEPTLVSADPAGRARRVEFLCRAIDAAATLDAECVSLWSGTVRDESSNEIAMDRLTSGLAQVLEYAEQHDVNIGFEPEPGMFIDTLDRFRDLVDELNLRRVDTKRLQLTLDIGHLHCQGELPIGDKIREWADRLVNVHIEDMRAGVHEHLMFGEGEIDFPTVLATLANVGYAGLVNVELTRHAQVGAAAAQQAYDFLQPLVARPPASKL
jgi:L-ribulose-5-phosphate 3-epimerase